MNEVIFFCPTSVVCFELLISRCYVCQREIEGDIWLKSMSWRRENHHILCIEAFVKFIFLIYGNSSFLSECMGTSQEKKNIISAFATRKTYVQYPLCNWCNVVIKQPCEIYVAVPCYCIIIYIYIYISRVKILKIYYKIQF